MGHNSTKGNNQDKKNMGQLFFDEESIYEISFFDEESIYEISKLYLKFVTDRHTDRSMDGRAQSNMSLPLFHSWGHKKHDKLENKSSSLLFFQFCRCI